MYRTLKSTKIVETCTRLQRRIEERFPDAGLAKVAAELNSVAVEALQRCEQIRRPNIPLRVGAWATLIVGLGALAWAFTFVTITKDALTFTNFVTEVEATFGALFFIGAIALFLTSLETRVKRRRALNAIRELRALAHIVDMHQLTKDPERILNTGPSTQSSPTRVMTPFELSRYFDYCSELLSLISKLGALYVQEFPDSGALAAIDELETLTTGLSRKIWQKIMILDRYHDLGPEEREMPLAAEIEPD